MKSSVLIREFDPKADRDQVIALWKRVFGYPTAHNEPGLSIDKKLAVHDGLFFVAVDTDGVACGTVMGGYDGHRGWIYSLAVLPDRQGSGVGRSLMDRVEQALIARGCLKINLQITDGNEAVQAFYERLGYTKEVRVSMGKRIPQNVPSSPHNTPASRKL